MQGKAQARIKDLEEEIEKLRNEHKVLSKALEESEQRQKILKKDYDKLHTDYKALSEEKAGRSKDMQAALDKEKKAHEATKLELRDLSDALKKLPKAPNKGIKDFLHAMMQYYEGISDISEYEKKRRRNIEENTRLLNMIKTSTPGPSSYEPFDGDLDHSTEIESQITDDETIDLTEPISVLNNHDEETVEELLQTIPSDITNNNTHELSSSSGTLPILKAGTFEYQLTFLDVEIENEAFKPGLGKIQLIEDYNVFIKKSDFDMALYNSKESVTGLMWSLLRVFYTKQWLAACSNTNGLHKEIKGAIFAYSIKKYELDKHGIMSMKRNLTSKCGEDRRQLQKRL